MKHQSKQSTNSKLLEEIKQKHESCGSASLSVVVTKNVSHSFHQLFTFHSLQLDLNHQKNEERRNFSP